MSTPTVLSPLLLEFQIDSIETLRAALVEDHADTVLFVDVSTALEEGASVQVRCVAREFTLYLDGTIVAGRRPPTHTGVPVTEVCVRIDPSCGERLAFLSSGADRSPGRVRLASGEHLSHDASEAADDSTQAA